MYIFTYIYQLKLIPPTGLMNNKADYTNMTKIIKLRSELKEIYQNLELCEDRWSSSHEGESISTYEMQVGNKFPQEPNSGIIFYGRSCNGWDRSCPNGIEDNRKIYDMSIMEKDSSKRPFLQLCKLISNNFYEDNWYEYIAWSNITKLVFCSGGNPTEELWQEQLDYLPLILKKEIEIMSPQIVIFVVGDSVKKGYETPIYQAFPQLRKKKSYSIKWGEYKRYDVSYPLTCSSYELDEKVFIFTDRPEHQKYMKEHINAIIDLIGRDSCCLDAEIGG